MKKTSTLFPFTIPSQKLTAICHLSGFVWLLHVLLVEINHCWNPVHFSYLSKGILSSAFLHLLLYTIFQIAKKYLLEFFSMGLLLGLLSSLLLYTAIRFAYFEPDFRLVYAAFACALISYGLSFVRRLSNV